MKKGITYWSFEGGLEGKADTEAVMKQAKAAGFDSIELAVPGGALSFDSSEAQCSDIARLAKSIGIEISSVATGVYWGTSLTANDPAVRKQAVEYTKKLLQIARWLGTDAILVVPGAVDVFFDPKAEHIPYAECYKRSQQSLKACVKTAEKLKVSICLENVWNKFLLSPIEYRDFIDSFDSRYVKSYFDCGNVRLTGFPEHWIELLGRRIGRVHWKDFKFVFYGGGETGDAAPIAEGCRKIAAGSSWAGAYSFCDLGAGDVNWKAVMSSLRKVRYNAYVTAEMLPWRPGLPEQVSRDMGKLLKL
ncbi:MAG TPA: sugar phosphate isomerase/epimerase family protein [Planctomycetota bacterium]|nr:sugar phosphate isomerase/epimerase family protein [Planctomycetota bacterium]